MFFKKLSKRHIGLPLALIVLYILIISSLVLEYFLKYEPSVLCVAQRCVMVLSLLFVTLAFFAKGESYNKSMDLSCISLCFGAIVSFYHLMIQNGFLEEPSFCRNTLPQNIGAQELEEIIRKNAEISCTNIGPELYGISFDMVVFVMFSFLFIYLAACFRRFQEEGNYS